MYYNESNESIDFDWTFPGFYSLIANDLNQNYKIHDNINKDIFQ